MTGSMSSVFAYMRDSTPNRLGVRFVVAPVRPTAIAAIRSNSGPGRHRVLLGYRARSAWMRTQRSASSEGSLLYNMVAFACGRRAVRPYRVRASGGGRKEGN